MEFVCSAQLKRFRNFSLWNHWENSSKGRMSSDDYSCELNWAISNVFKAIKAHKILSFLRILLTTRHAIYTAEDGIKHSQSYQFPEKFVRFSVFVFVIKHSGWCVTFRFSGVSKKFVWRHSPTRPPNLVSLSFWNIRKMQKDKIKENRLMKCTRT